MRRTMVAVWVGLIVLLLAAGSVRSQESWMSLVPGLEYRVVAWELPETGFGVDLHVLRADPEVVRLKVLDARDFGGLRMTAREFAFQTGAVAVINGGYFDTANRPVGLVMREGEVTSGLRRRDWGVFLVDDVRAWIVHTRQYQRRKTITQALQTGPPLVLRGRETTIKQTFRRRSAVGIDRAGRILLVVALTTGPDATMTLAELGAILRMPEAEGGLGCRDALSLDGGGSSQLVVNTGASFLEVPGEMPVVTAIGVFYPAAELPPAAEAPTIEQLPTGPVPSPRATPPKRRRRSIFRPWE
ncbi:MAG: phosphodiester glycosidase family protein [bacterium]|nr:phosphodiester glycosidase family protein [bacterium]